MKPWMKKRSYVKVKPDRYWGNDVWEVIGESGTHRSEQQYLLRNTRTGEVDSIYKAHTYTDRDTISCGHHAREEKLFKAQQIGRKSSRA